MSENNDIIVINAVENNLKHVSVSIPKSKLTVVTGVSGSGKSSLVFDTIAAESRRELNETFPSFVQHYLPKYGRPHVDVIKNLPVTIIIDQKKLGDNVRSTVGTYTDIYTFVRLLFSRIGKPFIGYSDTFSFNHPDGKCPVCDGLGFRSEIHVKKLVDFDKSLNEGAIDFPTFHAGFWRWKRYANSGLFDLDKKIKDYSPQELELFLYAPQQKLKNPPSEWPHTALYEGLIPRMQRSIINKDEGKRHAKRLAELMTLEECPACNGTRVNDRVRSCKIMGKNISDICLMPLDEVLGFVDEIDAPLAVDIKRELSKRLKALLDIGLGYLTLSRASGTLSGGEAQRVKIAKYINGSLTDIVYVLDEPSSGLHPHDIIRLKNALVRLKEQGNTLIMVEHNPDLIYMAEYVIDMGPGAGANGGEVMYMGSLDGLRKTATLTSKDLNEKVAIKENTRMPKGWLSIQHATYHNLKDVSVDIPLGIFCVLCGVAGSGKSSLSEVAIGEMERDVISISQKSIGVNLRSTPATYFDIGDEIRKLFAKENNISASYFSFNSKGACPKCKGKGVIVTDMSFMEDIVTVCEACGGSRYDEKVLHYTYHGKNIAEVMGLSVKESLLFFKGMSFVSQLDNLAKVGLDYLYLNQSLSTLSGGELQRLKLASNLERKGSIYVLDEPTAGLHMDDVKQLLKLFNELVDAGNSLLVLEHNLAVIKQADWLIELGPEGGERGGKVIFSGTPLEMKSSPNSITAPFL
ncbi:ATP-binding cassette domain-containing protein [Olivibacter sitiensis]|uniref:ATP-binding cassette domain-containing protein n=1 Tax=Olivibacter sitiensis TaxID=376470 RepID=UPI00041F5851|nr:excinuclease ABC subunit UvrA [Olivibacter sitiensis]